jgi:alginate O-acetyltransferase complex protein AlgI
MAAALALVPLAAWWSTRGHAAWVTMWAVAFAMFFAIKLLTLIDALVATAGRAGVARALAYLALWPGLNAREFLGDAAAWAEWRHGRVFASGLANFFLGIALLAWALPRVADPTPLATGSLLVPGWAGMVGLILVLHFGAFRAMAWAWCRAGVNAPPIMRNPLAATSLAEFWGERWNIAFAETARRFIFRPLARRAGARAAGAAVFLVSGLVHESVLSLPVRDGWGGPTLYFVLQALGIAVEKSAVGRRLGLGGGARGWIWTALLTAAPVPLLFHAPFVAGVMVPFLREIFLLLP